MADAATSLLLFGSRAISKPSTGSHDVGVVACTDMQYKLVNPPPKKNLQILVDQWTQTQPPFEQQTRYFFLF